MQEKRIEINYCYHSFIYLNQRGGGGGGGQGVRIPLKNHKNKGFFSAILVRIPCKTTKLTSQNSVLGHHQPVSETTFKNVSLAGLWPLIVLFGSSVP